MVGTRDAVTLGMTTPKRPLREVLSTLSACKDSLAFAAPFGTDWSAALAECPERAWLYWLAGRLMAHGHLDRKVLVMTACACARTALRYVPSEEVRPLRAIEAAEAWCRGETTIKDVRAARMDAAAAAYASASADAAAAAYASASADAARKQTDAELLTIVKRDLGPALLTGLTAYAATLPEAVAA